MTGFNSLSGQILVSQPKNLNPHFAKSIVLVVQHGVNGAWGVVVNKESNTLDVHAVMNAAGIDFKGNLKAYLGGPVEPARVHVVHSMDWFSSSTLQITPDLGITGDMSVLAAIAANEGPKLWRAGVGLAAWSAGQLEGEQSGISPWTPDHRWLVAPATPEICLTGSGEEQWQRAIGHCVNQKIADLF